MKFIALRFQQRGVAAVELGLTLVFLLLIAAGIFEFGRAFWHYNALAKATRDGARLMSVNAKTNIASVGIAAAKSLVVQEVNGANLTPQITTANVVVTCSPSCTDGAAPNSVTVQISGYTLNIGGVFPFFNPNTLSTSNIPGIALAPYTTMPYMAN